MFINAYKKALGVLLKKPIMLWGLSLLAGIITSAISMAFGILPVVGIAAAGVISCGMCKVYIDGLFGKKVNSDQLFAGFTGNFMRIAGGYLWMILWMGIWAMVPVVGIIKAYSYRFVPYILITRPDVTATQALRLSMQMTKGKKGQMFLADLCFSVAIGVLAALCAIPVLGILFILVMIVVALLSNVFIGLYSATFYIEACKDEKKAAAQAAEVAPQA